MKSKKQIESIQKRISHYWWLVRQIIEFQSVKKQYSIVNFKKRDKIRIEKYMKIILKLKQKIVDNNKIS